MLLNGTSIHSPHFLEAGRQLSNRLFGMLYVNGMLQHSTDSLSIGPGQEMAYSFPCRIQPLAQPKSQGDCSREILAGISWWILLSSTVLDFAVKS